MTPADTFDRDAFLVDLRALIGFQTIVCENPQSFHDANDWIRAFFDSVQVEFQEFECHGLVSTIIKPRDSARPRMLGDGHIEVVPAEAAQFDLRERDGLLCARGVADMKTQCLMMMLVLRELIAEGHHNDFWLLLSEDEERGSEHGVALVAERLYREGNFPRAVFAPDGGPDFSYVEKEKGLLRFSVEVHGTAAHGSRPYLADNAIEKAFELDQDLRATFPNPRDEDDWRMSLAMTTISAGEAQNQIPGECAASFDARITETDEPEVVTARIREICERHDASVTFGAPEPAAVYPRSRPIARRFIDILREESGHEPTILHSAGASNGRIYLRHDPEVPVLMSGPRVGGAHGPDEWLDPDSLDAFYRVVRRSALMKLEARPVVGAVEREGQPL